MPGPYTFPTDRVTGGPAPAADFNALAAAFNEATPLATPNVLALRDEAGRFQAADPLADEDVATKGWVNDQGFSTGGGGGAGGLPEPQYAAGYYYGPTHILNGTHDAFTTAAGKAYWMMFKVGEETPFDRMCLTVGNTPVAGNQIRLGLYNSARLRPTSRVFDAGMVDTTSGGQKVLTIAQTLAVGVYWICMVAGSSTLQIRATTSGGVRTWNQGHTAGDWWEDGACFRTNAASVATALPSTADLTGFNPGSGVSNDVPWITLRAA
jgi:hypothetical protein